MKVLLFGGLGFIGANVTEALGEAGHEVYIAHRPGSPARKPAIAEFVRRYAHLVEYIDPRLPLERVRPDAVVNLVGEYFGPDRAIREANLEFPRRLCEAAAGWRGKVIHISAATVRGPVGEVIREEERHLEGISPVTSFDRYKAEGERTVARCFGDWVVIRPVLVYGRFNDHPEWVTLVKAISRGVAPLMRSKLSVISARELAKAVRASLSLSKEFFFATECEPRPFSHFATAVAKALGRRPLPVPVPTFLLGLAARELRGHLPFLGRAFSCEKMRKLLGWTPAPDFEREVAEMTYYITHKA
ncbi:MAG: NAD-dependent epimerase/dehydratase family protein [Pyrobaculum sp.]